jgi:hypothetical protein
LGPFIPTTITSFLFDVVVSGWHFDPWGAEAAEFFYHLPRPWHDLHKFEFRIHASSIEATKSTVRHLISVLDTRLASPVLFPAFKECQCTIVFDKAWLSKNNTALEVGMNGVGDTYETSLQSWFASLHNTSCLAVIWELSD